MGKQNKRTKTEIIDEEEKYVIFLKRKLASDNFKANSTVDEYELTKRKYDKAKLKLKFLKES